MPKKLTGTADAARRLGISQTRVSCLIREGSLKADRVGRVWVVDDESLDFLESRGVAGRIRSLSPRDAWAAAMLAEDETPDWVTRAQRARLRAKVDSMAVDDAGRWAWLMHRRASRKLEVRVHRSIWSNLVKDFNIMRPDIGLIPPEVRVEEGRELVWTTHSTLIALVQTPEVRASSRPNVVVRAIPRDVGRVDRVPAVLAACDLLDEADSRARRAGAWFLQHSIDRSTE